MAAARRSPDGGGTERRQRGHAGPHRGLRLLLLGDLEPPAQRALARSPAARDLAGVDVLKVAHHGSAYQDPGLLDLAAPRLALISTGEDNSYGHPAPGTVEVLRARERPC